MSNKNEHNSKKSKNITKEYVEPFLTALIIAIVIRAFVIYPFRIPTGSMEDTLLVGDFLLANKFVYGLRTPDWIGIPYTKIGFFIPFIQTPGFRKPKQGDVVIFKQPRDQSQNYIKRCIAVSGDTVEIRDKAVYVNSIRFPDAPKGKYIDDRIYNDAYKEFGIYPPDTGNRDNYGPIRIPAPGDTFCFHESNKEKWFEQLQTVLYEGNKISLTYRGESTRLTVKNQHQWERAIKLYPAECFSINDHPLNHYIYVLKNRHYFMLGDNRDNSLDSRYWGFLPERYVVGEALIVYFSWDSEIPGYQLLKKIRFPRILNLIR